ncbi:S8 family serine peptidase [candidate division KSB1 bacterium]
MKRIKQTRKIIILLSLIISASFFVSFDGSSEKYWVYFRDKKGYSAGDMNKHTNLRRRILSERSINRRKKVLGDNPLQDSDLPVSATYLLQLRNSGYRPVVVSKWLNAASFYLTPSDITEINRLPIVKDVKPVIRHIRKSRESLNKPADNKLNDYFPPEEIYGNSYSQNNLIRTIGLHNARVTGRGILIGFLDTGYNLEHESLEDLDVFAEYDFINRDFVTRNEAGQDGFNQDNHGTAVLSVVGGLYEGALIGTAHGASFALAKTEDNSGETAIEEDYWVAGIEWLDSLGADVVTSSLGYNIFSDGEYTKDEMDGNTAVTSIAAALAAEKGIVVVNSAGNEGNNSWGIITAPADADGILAVGAVNSAGTIANFSSRGPTADGRIKPDVVALGVSVFSAYSGFYSLYSFPDGTSMAAPMVAGAAALLLSAHPELTPAEVINAFKITSDRSGNPDNTYGWGLIDAYAAASYYGPVFSNRPVIEEIPEGMKITVDIISKYGVDDGSARLYYNSGSSSNFKSVLFRNGSEDEYYAVLPEVEFENEETINFFMTAKDNSGRTSFYPGNNENSSFSFNSLLNELTLPMRNDRQLDQETPVEFTLYQNYPNPFNYRTNISIDLRETSDCEISIFNITGRKVKTLYKGELSGGGHAFYWDGTNYSDVPAATGVYFCRMSTRKYTKTVKMLLLR